MTIKVLAYLIIPVYTIAFNGGYNWFTTNFSVIGNLMDKKLAFLIWGIVVGLYFYLIYRRLRPLVRLRPLFSQLIPAALALLFCAITTPYLPDEMPLKSFLHIVFAFVSTVLLLIYLAAVVWVRYRLNPGPYRPYLAGLALILVISLVLLAMAGIISSALEIFVTLTTVAMSERLSNRIRREGPWKKAATLWSLTGSRAA